MSLQVAITHKTRYLYDRQVALSPHVFRLRPAVHTKTPILAYSLKIAPEKQFLSWQQDAFGNFQARVVFPEKANELSVSVEVIADLTVINPFDFFQEEYADDYPFSYPKELRTDLLPYLEITESGKRLRKWVGGISRKKLRLVDFLVGVNQRVHEAVGYTLRLEPGVQTCKQTLKRGSGSCRDSAWLLVQTLRHLGLASRFVSGYLVQLVSDLPSLDGPSGATTDFTDLHAWAEVYVPGAGWLGMDPTSGLFTGEGHIPLACTPAPGSAAPVVGATDECEVEFEFENAVTRIHEDPRVTKPYSDWQWSNIDQLGQQVDRELAEHDVRLSMGGEPTFVSIDDLEGDEWNTTADSPVKRSLANDLLGRLRQAFAPGGMLHYGEGKWYPGEPLPRWAYHCFWRKDGISIWENGALIGTPDTSYQHDIGTAAEFSKALAERLGVSPEFLVAGYEDIFYCAWKEQALPTNVDPYKSDLNDPIERQVLAGLLDSDLNSPVGYALPLKWDSEENGWSSAPWKFRRSQMVLTPGTSAMGFRLPLNSLPWVSEADAEPHIERSPFHEHGPLEHPADVLATRFQEQRPSDEPVERIKSHEMCDDPDVSLPQVPRTALCVEPRDGCLHVFLPPVMVLEHYLEFVAAVESVATKMKTPVIIEGYEPPQDYRLERLSVTPDPGVIEVNIQPAITWNDLVRNTTVLYDEARLARLGAEKFMIDGRHTGTGGGNHITLGGLTPADSPFLRKPGVLRSFLTYWQHHPGLSYLFSGMFIGPTSQAPRVDEGRDDKLYELEIAFQQLPDAVDSPWLVDRVLRHLLTDLTGNTHRAEFCIDKLFSPDRQSGRLGLLEMRAFEMPPHSRMSLVQMLLLRCLMAKFWQEPYHHRLVRWGTELHDRFMLPFFVRDDLRDVVADLQSAGYDFNLDWLDAFQEFRFPVFGRVECNGIDLELRFAIEPWHVLGEEATGSGTARYVDSSVERLQLLVRGMTDSRHVITCNGRRVPLYPAGIKGQFVTGVRYKAWDPHSALHPTIGLQSPLVFDVVDTWNGRSIGGCVYHVSHPGGLGYETLPVNAYEAEARRVTRFWQHGHTQGTLEKWPSFANAGRRVEIKTPGDQAQPMAPAPEEINDECPMTLDLRHDSKLLTSRIKAFAN